MFGELIPDSHHSMEPSNLENPFNMYSITPKITQAEIKNLILEIGEDVFRNIEFNEQNIEGDNVVTYTVESKETHILVYELVSQGKEFFTQDRLYLYFKFHKTESKLTIMSFSPLELNFTRIENDIRFEFLQNHNMPSTNLESISFSRKQLTLHMA